MLSTKCFRQLFLFVLFCGNKQSHRLKQNWSIFSQSSLTFLFTRLTVFPLDCFFFFFILGVGRRGGHNISVVFHRQLTFIFCKPCTIFFITFFYYFSIFNFRIMFFNMLLSSICFSVSAMERHRQVPFCVWLRVLIRNPTLQVITEKTATSYECLIYQNKVILQ